jgi:hypothetical protein
MAPRPNARVLIASEAVTSGTSRAAAAAAADASLPVPGGLAADPDASLQVPGGLAPDPDASLELPVGLAPEPDPRLQVPIGIAAKPDPSLAVPGGLAPDPGGFQTGRGARLTGLSGWDQTRVCRTTSDFALPCGTGREPPRSGGAHSTVGAGAGADRAVAPQSATAGAGAGPDGRVEPQSAAAGAERESHGSSPPPPRPMRRIGISATSCGRVGQQGTRRAACMV